MKESTKYAIAVTICTFILVVIMIIMCRTSINKFEKTRAGQKVEQKLNYWLSEPNETNKELKEKNENEN